MFAFEGKPAIWWLDVKAVMDMHGIEDAEELNKRLFVIPAPTVTIPQGIMSNDAPKPPKPTIGRIVHYVDKERIERVAFITGISRFVSNGKWVYLKAIIWSGEDISDFAIYSEDKKDVRTWHWPEREE